MDSFPFIIISLPLIILTVINIYSGIGSDGALEIILNNQTRNIFGQPSQNIIYGNPSIGSVNYVISYGGGLKLINAQQLYRYRRLTVD